MLIVAVAESSSFLPDTVRHRYEYTLSPRVHMPSVSARLPREEKDELDAVAELLDEDRSTTIRKALREGLRELRVQRAVERYQAGDASVADAARIAGVSLGEWLEIARERNLTTKLVREDLEGDADAAREL
jgi:predicted HTH domain antitoxin